MLSGIVTVLGLFALRLVVPIAVTLLAGEALRRSNGRRSVGRDLAA